MTFLIIFAPVITLKIEESLEIEEIYPPYLYSIKYSKEKENEYYRLLDNWNDFEYVSSFLHENKEYLNHPIWSKFQNIEVVISQIRDEAEELENRIESLAENSSKRNLPNFDSFFKLLGGDFKYETEYIPMKSYSHGIPPLLRLYAIKMDTNTYLITGGGIKLADKIQNSPDLKDHVLQNISKVRQWLKENGIFDSEDMVE